MKRLLVAFVLLTSLFAAAQSQDVLGVHDLSSGATQTRGGLSAACLYCHAPHSGIGKGPLWSQQLSTQVYPSLYSSDTLQNLGTQPAVGASSSLCLSCHDGTVAPGQTRPYGPIQMSQDMANGLVPNLAASHPISLKLPIQDASNLVPGLASSGTTEDLTNSVKLIKGNLECTSCHDPHNQRKDQRNQNFLVRDNANGPICLACHTTSPRTVNNRNNPLDQWKTGIHSKSGAAVNISAGMGGYNTVSEFACSSCHVSHNAGTDTALLRVPSTPIPNVDPTSQACAVCHAGGTTLVSPLDNVFQIATLRGHPFPSGVNRHTPGEKVVLDNNRHAGCADCHNGHAAQPTPTPFSDAPNVRPSQYGVPGVASNGTPLTGNAANQYEICLRCHGNSVRTGTTTAIDYGYLPNRAAVGGDQLNLITQFGATAVSEHPVMRDATHASQPSLRVSMYDINGVNQLRAIGNRIFCTDCHNSENNREFGGTGPNGPHGSQNDHILERNYVRSQVAAGAAPGTDVINLVTGLTLGDPRLQPNSTGPFALCAKCHNLDNIMSNASFDRHREHLEDGFSCSVCHSAHGVGGGTPGTSGQRLVNFDLNVVAPANNGVLSYSNGSCTLMCHGRNHGNLH